jgi:hypothetical protein
MSLNCLTRPGTKTGNLTKTKKQTPKISETKISQILLEGRKTRDGKADQVRDSAGRKLERLKRVNKHIQIQNSCVSWVLDHYSYNILVIKNLAVAKLQQVSSF